MTKHPHQLPLVPNPMAGVDSDRTPGDPGLSLILCLNYSGDGYIQLAHGRSG